MKRKDTVKEMEKLDATGLKERAKSLAEELMKLRFRKAAGRLEHPHRLHQVRKDLARIKTYLSRTNLKQADVAQ